MQSPHNHSAQNSHAGTLSASASPTPEFTIRPALPDRDVTAENIEDAYVRFIFFCNPAVPLTSDTVSLREAFRNPPKSGGKSFSSFTIYELVKQFYNKEIKTWTELTTKLGVDPPDPNKDESTQKVAQYGVRLKKWMNSLHVKAFFEYLMNMPNDYWTKVPNDPNPIGQPIRDGVAVEDDMALRALLPHIRPKRGRKRPADNDSISTPISRTHLAPQSAVDGFRQGAYGPWSAMPDASKAAPWHEGESLQTPLSRWPQSAITPTVTRGSPWDDMHEPQSAITPSRPKRRRGPKNVSSAWRPGAVDGGGKTRGRPPINRLVPDPSAPEPSSGNLTMNYGEAIGSAPPQISQTISVQGVPPGVPSENLSYHQSMPASMPAPQKQPVPEGSRPTRPSISLQVPERPSGTVRLATPPPVVMINGETNGGSGQNQNTSSIENDLNGRTDFTHPMHPKYISRSPSPQPRHVPEYYFENVEDRTNMEEVMGFLTKCTRDAEWIDTEGNTVEPPPIEEVTALVNTTIEAMWKATESPEAFLINLAAMAGGHILLSNKSKVRRLGSEGGFLKYRCEWEYQFGTIRGFYTMEQGVPEKMAEGREKYNGKLSEEEEKNMTTEQWQQKYHDMLEELRKKDRELLNIRSKLLR